MKTQVIVSHAMAGWSTWNGNCQELATDAALIHYWKAGNRNAFLERAEEICLGGRFAAAYFNEALTVTEITTGRPFRIVYDRDSRCEKIEHYNEKEWII